LRRVVVLVAAAGLLALSACSQPTAAAQDSEAPPGIMLVAAKVGVLGAIVTDQNGRTLYRFDKDKPSVSNCSGECTKSWPPVIVSDAGELKLDSIDQSLVGTLDRADGSKQVTLAGHPMYRFFKDSKAGDVNGQGLGGTWFVAAPSGDKIVTKPQKTTETPKN
jgi:predicted lipoprotein with Yx(FWY)xxD motif